MVVIAERLHYALDCHLVLSSGGQVLQQDVLSEGDPDLNQRQGIWGGVGKVSPYVLKLGMGNLLSKVGLSFA